MKHKGVKEKFNRRKWNSVQQTQIIYMHLYLTTLQKDIISIIRFTGKSRGAYGGTIFVRQQ